MKAAFYTLGCKVNQYESQIMAQQFAQAGFETAGWEEPAQVYVLNSCTVTAQGDKKARQLLHRVRRQHPGALTVLCGCFPQAFPRQAAAVAEADVVAGTARAALPGLVRRALQTGQRVVEIAPHLPHETFEPMSALAMEGHTRAFVKIEDGCDRRCAYCIIPQARGHVRSKPLQALADEAAALARRGFCEIVLTGVNLSSYGRGEGFGLAEAVRAAAAAPGVARVRLGSLEPDLTGEELIAALAAEPGFCPQFHLSVQSGCDATLARMGRHYTAAQYLELCETLRRAFDLPAVTTDLMVGFPGESDEEFAQSLDFIGRAGFARVHVFPFSPRPGTPAAAMADQVDPRTRERRAAQAAAAAGQAARRFMEAMAGRTEPVLFERCALPGLGRGHTPNGTPVQVESSRSLRGLVLPVRLLGPAPGGEFCLGLSPGGPEGAA